MPVKVEVGNVPEWLDHERLLGPEFTVTVDEPGWCRATASLERPAAADVQARLRGVGIGGRALKVNVTPSLNRKLVRAARTDDARRRRSASVGFSRSGVRLDREGQISLTPEVLAFEAGQRAQKCTVVDALCGAGGNAIGFARAGCTVVALEIDDSRMAMAVHNAEVYGVSRSIEWHCVDATTKLASLNADLLFVDPPWSEEYDRTRVRFADMPLLERLLSAATHFPKIWLKLPPSFDVADLPNATPQAVFGVGDGDKRRVKYLILELLSS